jgi:putative tryptophan/tyrosine transport system substrate-binding protein
VPNILPWTRCSLVGGCQLTIPLTATLTRVRRIGFLYSGSRDGSQAGFDAFVGRLREFGWVEGETLNIEWRFAEGRADLLPELGAELVHLPVEVILAVPTDASLAAQQQTSSLPIVFVAMSGPLGSGLVKSFTAPGGNITGVTAGVTGVRIKSVELLKTVLPQLSRLAILGDRSLPAFK